MPLNDDLRLGSSDPVVFQAETILAQRQARALVIDRDLLGEPGWDILLCAFIAHRKGSVCEQHDIANEIDLSISLVSRWVDILSLRGLLLKRDDFFVISESVERKLSMMFELQIKQALEMFADFQKNGAPSAVGQSCERNAAG